MWRHKRLCHGIYDKGETVLKYPDGFSHESTSNQNMEIQPRVESSIEEFKGCEMKLRNDQDKSMKLASQEYSVATLVPSKKGKKIYRCSRCNYSTTSRLNLSVHARQRRTHPVLECPVPECNFKSCFRLGISLHKNRFHEMSNKRKNFRKQPDVFNPELSSNRYPEIGATINSSVEKLEAKSETKLGNDQANSSKFFIVESSVGILGQDKQAKIYRCDHCSYSTNLRANLDVHTRQRKGHPVQECPVTKCNYKSCFRKDSTSNQNPHINTATNSSNEKLEARSETKLETDQVNRIKFVNMGSSIGLLGQDKQEKTYRCDLCSFSANLAMNLSVHVSQRRTHPVLECLVPKCNYKSCFRRDKCTDVTVVATLLVLQTHGILTQLDQIHLKSKLHEYQYRCESCSYSTNLEDLRSSIVIWDQDNQPKQYRCDRCSYSTNSLANLSTHARQRRTRPILECSVPNCNYKSCFNSGMWRHKRQYHGIHNKKEIVPLFPDGFNEESTSNQNPDVGSAFDPSTEKFNSTGILGQSKPEQTYRCERCSYSTNVPWSLSVHAGIRRTHPVLECSVPKCDYKSCFNSGMWRHKRQYHGIHKKNETLSLFADGINEESTSIQNLYLGPEFDPSTEKFNSTGILGQSKPEQTYRCERCSYSTNVPWSLSVHAGIRRTHPVLECSVPKCDYKSCFNSGMWRHKRQYHGIHKKNETLSLFADGINEESTSIQNLYLGPEFDPSTEKFNATGIFGEIKPEQTYRCERCSYSTNSLANLSTHARQRRTRPVLECSVPNCNYKSCFNSGMWRHKRQYHGIHKKNETVPSLPDGFNEESTSNQTPNLRPTFDPSTEKFNATEIFGQDKKEKTYRCESCSYSTNFRPNLEMHARQRRSHPVLECSVPKCSFKACFRASMVRHSKQSHEMFNKPKIVPQISHSLCPKTEEKLVDFSNPDCSLNTLNDEKIYKCDRCSFSTTFRGSISIHLRRRVNQPVSMCSEPGCSYKSCFKLSMVKHKNMNHPLRKTLRIKNKGFTSNNSKIKKLSCPFCNYMCNLRSTLNVHVKQHRAFSKNTKLNQSLISCGKENKYSCGRCSFSTANPRNMFVHKKCQTKYPVLKCSYPKCQYTSCFRIGLTKHTIRVHGGDCKEDVPNHGFFKLTSSSALSLQKSRLQLTKQQDPTKEFKCDRCSYSTNRHGLGRHRNRAHGMGSLPTNPACVTSSVQRHAFSCPFCNYTCRLKSVLSIHLSRHRTIAGQKKLTRTPTTETHALFRSDATAIKDEQRIYFSCPYCDYSSDCRVEVGVIEKHEKRHSKERSLGCELCGKVFAVHENLRRHELLHRNKSFLRGKGLKLKKFG
ncbi:unnamed protein product [Allacma fusca]|uniref:C2H2-type domain-containing protein n=1 Tax=Allacma fusca TaxID=39272 RepID=A0A8J2J7W7_9HEXA|nr:unnamed protein product [Allacma fusca]